MMQDQNKNGGVVPDAKIRIGLYGINGHQIERCLEKNPLAELVAIAAFPSGRLPASLSRAPISSYASLDELLAKIPFNLDEEVSPTLWALRTKALAGERPAEYPDFHPHPFRKINCSIQ